MNHSIVFSELQEELNICFEAIQSVGNPTSLWCEEDRKKWQRIASEAKRNEMAASRLALLRAGNLDALDAMYFEGKRPAYPDAHISISHCKDGAVAVYSKTLRVGIDIELERTQLAKISHKFIRADEEKFLETLGRQHAMQLLWGIKESLFKLHGLGGLDFKSHLHVVQLVRNSSDTGWEGVAWIEKGDIRMQTLVQALQHEGMYVCVATHRPEIAPFESERLVLREWQKEDAPWLFNLNSDPDVIEFTGDAGFESIEAAEGLITQYPNYQRDGYGRWMVTLKDGTPIGWCGLKRNPWGIDLGFRFFQAQWDKGYATEAAQATIHWAKTHGLSRLVGRALTGNPASIRVLEKLGFTAFDAQPIEEFATGQYIREEDLQRWSGQLMLMMKLDL